MGSLIYGNFILSVEDVNNERSKANLYLQPKRVLFEYDQSEFRVYFFVDVANFKP